MTKPVSHAYQFCPQCGARSDLSGQVPFRCAHCDYANFFGPVAAVGALITNDSGELLFVRRARDPGRGKWGLPGGFVDPGESGETAVAREVAEETGLQITNTKYLLSLPNEYVYQGLTSSIVDLFFEVTVHSLEHIELAPAELDHFEWSEPTEEFLQNMAFRSNRLAIEHWMQCRTR